MFAPKIAIQLCKQLPKSEFTKCRRLCSQVPLNFDDIPTPKGLPFIGTRLSLWLAGSSKNLHEYVDRRHRELGPIYREKLGPVTGTFVADADAIRGIFSQEGKYPVHIIPQSWTIFNQKHGYERGLLFMNGQDWLDHRKVMNKLLLKGNTEWMERGCDFVIENFVKNLKDSSDCHKEEILDAKLYRTFLDVLVSLLLGQDSYIKSHQNLSELINHLAVIVNSVFETTSKLQMIPADWAAKLNIPRWKLFENSMQNALIGADTLVEKLLRECNHTDGLLGKMLEENINEQKIRAVVADLILAAADTTAYTMQWMLYLVAKDKDLQAKIREQISIPSSTYIKNVLKETLRMYPVAPFITRFLPHESQIAGYKIPMNSLLIMSIYTTGRNEKYFKNAKDFLPERWDRGNEDMVKKQASLPFAMGTRSCVGKRLAEYELQKMLVELVKNFELKLCNKNEIKMILKLVAVPSESIRLTLKKIS